MKIYCISGIGADHRMFRHLRAPEGYELCWLNWIDPLPGEAVAEYAVRLGAGIDRSEPFMLLGLSLGGIVGVEIAKRLSPRGTILIASIPLSSQLPGYYRLAGRLGMQHVVPASVYKTAAAAKRYFTDESREDKEIQWAMIREGSDEFIRWAIQAVLDWKNEEVPAPLWHIHGSWDGIFPAGLTRPTHLIPRGGHSLLTSHPEEINRILREVTAKKENTLS